MQEPKNKPGKEEIPRESIELVISFVGMGFSVPFSLEMLKNQGHLSCHETTFYKKLKELELEESYHDAFQTRKLILEERLFEEVEKVKVRIASEYAYVKDQEGFAKRLPTKYIANTAGIQKLELKRKIIAGFQGKSERFRIVEGEKARDQIQSLKSALFKREIATSDAMNIMNVLDKEIAILEIDDIKKQIQDNDTRLRNIEIRSR